jgi:hypothetical protein
MNANLLLCISIAALASVSSPLSAAETEESCDARNKVDGTCRPYKFDAKTKSCLSSCPVRIDYRSYRDYQQSSSAGGVSGATGGGSSEHRAPPVTGFFADQIGTQPQFKFETKEQLEVKKAMSLDGTTLTIPAAAISTRLGKGR